MSHEGIERTLPPPTLGLSRHLALVVSIRQTGPLRCRGPSQRTKAGTSSVRISIPVLEGKDEPALDAVAVNSLKEIAMSHNIAAHRSHQHQAMCGSLDRRTAALLVRPETAERGRAVRVGRRTIRLE